MSQVIRKHAFCICENKGAEKQLCFGYINSTIPLLPEIRIFKASYLLWLYSPISIGDLCRTWSENSKTYFLMTRLKRHQYESSYSNYAQSIRAPTQKKNLFISDH